MLENIANTGLIFFQKVLARKIMSHKIDLLACVYFIREIMNVFNLSTMSTIFDVKSENWIDQTLHNKFDRKGNRTKP